MKIHITGFFLLKRENIKIFAIAEKLAAGFFLLILQTKVIIN
jgi:hypothetical protein